MPQLWEEGKESLMDDYPNDGQAVGSYTTPVDLKQRARARAEEAMIGSALPIIEDILDWFNQQIADANAIHRIKLNSKLSAETQILAFQEITRLLVEKRDEFQSKYEAYKSQREELRSGT